MWEAVVECEHPDRYSRVINAFTRSAQGLGPRQRIEAERFAAVLVDAPQASSYVQFE